MWCVMRTDESGEALYGVSADPRSACGCWFPLAKAPGTLLSSVWRRPLCSSGSRWVAIGHGFGLAGDTRGLIGNRSHTRIHTHLRLLSRVHSRAQADQPKCRTSHNITHLITQTLTLIHSNNVSHTHTQTLRGPCVSPEEGTSG